MIKKYEDLQVVPISDKHILDLVNKDATLISYDELAKRVENGKINTIYDLFGKHDAVILLYMTGKDFGHWTCCFENLDGSIEFFDSYGYKPDGEFSFISEKMKNLYYQHLPILTALLFASGVPIIYNQYHLQSSKNIPGYNEPPSTCGYWVATRLNYRNIPIDEFAEVFKDAKEKLGINGDYIVTLLNNFDTK